jgi:hypothetical protein
LPARTWSFFVPLSAVTLPTTFGVVLAPAAGAANARSATTEGEIDARLEQVEHGRAGALDQPDPSLLLRGADAAVSTAWSALDAGR